MADPTVAQVNTALDSFGVWVTKFNAAANVVATTAVTANAAANGAVTTGNGFVNGIMAATTLAAGTLRGGNVQAADVLSVASNVVVGNATSSVVLSYDASSGYVTVGAASVNAQSVSVGNSTVYSSVNSTALFSSSLLVGANVVATATGLSVGNSTSNSSVTQGLVSVASATGSANLSPSGLSAGASYVSATALGVGANVVATATGLSVGNSSVNAIVTAGTVTLSGQSVPTVANCSVLAQSGTLVGSAGRFNFSQTGGGIGITASVDPVGNQINVVFNVSGQIPSGVGGTNTDVLFNDSGQFGGASDLTFNKTTKTLAVTNAIVVGSAFVTPTAIGAGGWQSTYLTVSTSGSNAQLLDAFAMSSWRSAKYLIQVASTASNAYQTSEILVLHDGTTPLVTEYAVLSTNGTIATTSANANATHVTVWLAPTTNSATVRVTRELLVV